MNGWIFSGAMSVEDVANQLWGIKPSAPSRWPHDVAGLGSPPRDLDARGIAYAKKAVRARDFDARGIAYAKKIVSSLGVFWLMVTIFLGLCDVVGMSLGGHYYVPIPTLVFLGLTIYGFRRQAHERAKILSTLQNGTLHQAEITNMRAVPRRGARGRAVYHTYCVTFAFLGRSVPYVTRDPGVSLLQVGMTEEILWDERTPDVLIPTFLLVQ
jgi:hypothetical protein